jgi:hypothetical protein
VIYALSTLITGGVLFLCGVSLNHSRPGTFTPQDYANAVRKEIPETRISTTEIINPPEQKGGPLPRAKLGTLGNLGERCLELSQKLDQFVSAQLHIRNMQRDAIKGQNNVKAGTDIDLSSVKMESSIFRFQYEDQVFDLVDRCEKLNFGDPELTEIVEEERNRRPLPNGDLIPLNPAEIQIIADKLEMLGNQIIASRQPQ